MTARLQSTRLISSTGDVLKFDELITAVAFPHLILAGRVQYCQINHKASPPTALFLFPLPSSDRNVGSRGGQGPGPMANFNRSTEDLRIKQQSTSYGRLRECLPMGSQFVVEVVLFWPFSSDFLDGKSSETAF